MHNESGLQRTDRINLIIDTLEQNEFIKSVKTSSNTIFYQITEKGIEAYSQVSNFIGRMRAIRGIERQILCSSFTIAERL
jgi:predicted transcriptional regulator